MFIGLQAHGGGNARGNQKLVMSASGHGELSAKSSIPPMPRGFRGRPRRDGSITG